MSPHIAPARRAEARALWLAKLSEALDLADKLTVELGRGAEHVEAVSAIAEQIALIRAEIDTLRLGRFDSTDEAGPEWTNLSALTYTPRVKSPPPPKSSR